MVLCGNSCLRERGSSSIDVRASTSTLLMRLSLYGSRYQTWLLLIIKCYIINGGFVDLAIFVRHMMFIVLTNAFNIEIAIL